MATYRVYSGAAGANNGTSWTDAYTTLAAAVAVATAADLILIASDHSSTETTFNISLPATDGLQILSVDRTTETPTVGAIVTSSSSVTIRGHGYLYGIDFRTSTGANSGNAVFLGTQSTQSHNLTLEACTPRVRGSVAGPYLNIGIQTGSTNNRDAFVRLVNCPISFSRTDNNIRVGAARIEMVGCYFEASSSTPTNLFVYTTDTGGDVVCTGCDWSGEAWATLASFSANQGGAPRLSMSQCKFPSGWAVGAGAGNQGNLEVWVLDCSDADTHTTFGYYTSVGSVVSDTATKLTAGAAGQSWRITTTSAVKFGAPFTTPWIDARNTATTSLTPYLELLRNDGTESAFGDDGVWAETMVKTTSGSTASSLTSDRMALNGTPAAQAAGAGTGAWTIGSSNSPASFKVDSGAARTPAEVGHIRMRLCVGVEVAGTLYLDPFIRT